MRRPARLAVVPAALAAGLLVLAAPAGAKEISALTLCGAGGHCRPVPGGDRVRQAFMDGGSFLTNSPDRRAPFFTVVATVSAPGYRDIGSYSVRWVPSAGRIRNTGEFDRPFWTRPDARTTRALRRAAKGLRPKPAARLGALYVPPPKVRVTEVVNPPAPARAAARGEGPGTAILAAGGAALAAAVLAAGAMTHRRRGGRRHLGAPPGVT
jgi:hypothetical protein